MHFVFINYFSLPRPPHGRLRFATRTKKIGLTALVNPIVTGVAHTSPPPHYVPTIYRSGELPIPIQRECWRE